MKPTPACLVIAALASPISPLIASAQSPARDLADAQKLLASVKIEIEPGDGGEVASDGKLLYDNLLPLYVRLARAQKLAGNAPASKATLARATALCTTKKGTYQALVTVLVDESIRLGLFDEVRAFHEKHDTDGYRGPTVARFLAETRKDTAGADKLLVAALTKGATLEKSDDALPIRVTQLFRVLDVAKKHSLAMSGDAARAALTALLPKLETMDRCRAVSFGVADPDAESLPGKLTAEFSDNASARAMGLLYLGKTDDAKAALALVKPGGRVAPGLVTLLPISGYIALAKQAKSPDALIDAMLYLRQENLETPAKILALNDALITMAPDDVYSSAARLVAENLALLPASARNSPSLRKHAARLKANFAEMLKSQKDRPAEKGSYQSLAHQSDLGYALADLALLDPAFVRANLRRITEPRFRAVAQIALLAATR